MGSVQLASQISTFILSIFLQYHLGNAYGVYSYAFSLASLVFILADFGLGFQMVVDVSPNHKISSQYLTNTLFLRALLGGASMIITLVIVIISALPQDVSLAIMIIALSTAFNWISLTFTSMMTAFERMHYVLYTNLVERVFTVSVAIALLTLGFGLEAIVLVVLTGSMLNVVLSWLTTSKYITKPARRPDLAQSKHQIRTGVPYALTGVLTTSLYSLNAVLVWNVIMWTGQGSYMAAHATALYNLSFNLVVALIAVPTILITALLPVISRMYKTSTEMTKLTQQKVMKYMFSLGLPMSIGGIILADGIIQFFYAPEFWESARVFQYLVPVIAISYFGTGIGSVLASAKLIRLNTMASGVGATVNLVLCLVLIPFLGAIGAALAFTISFLALTITGLHFLTKNVFKVDLLDILIKPSVAGLGMGLVLVVLPGLFPGLGFIPWIIVGVVVYFALMLAVGALNKEDKEILVKILKKEA